VIGAIRAELNKSYDNRVFVSGFITNIVLASGLTFLGDRLGVDLSIAALVAFGVRLFNNVAIIRRHFIQSR
jgi:small basic protein